MEYFRTVSILHFFKVSFGLNDMISWVFFNSNYPYKIPRWKGTSNNVPMSTSTERERYPNNASFPRSAQLSQQNLTVY